MFFLKLVFIKYFGCKKVVYHYYPFGSIPSLWKIVFKQYLNAVKHFVHYAQYRGEKNIVMTEKEKFFLKKEIKQVKLKYPQNMKNGEECPLVF